MLITNSSRGDDTYGSRPKPSAKQSKSRATIRVLVVATIIIAVFVLWPHRAVRVYDGFDAAELSRHWLKWQFVPGSVKMQSKVVRAGSGAAEITLHRGDRREGPSEDGQLLERDEITESWRYFSRLHRNYRYSFSLYLPADFPVVPIRLVLAQWKQVSLWKKCSPVLAVRYEDGMLFVTRRDDQGRSMLYSTRREVRGQWLDFRFETRFAPGEDGAVQAWLNGEHIIDYRGPTTYRKQWGFPFHGFVYFKTGLYRNEMQQPMVLYVDEYRKEEISD